MHVNSEQVSGRALIIFYRNPEPGRVKTRLASTIGHQQALAIYLKLVEHTLKAAEPVAADKIVYYSEKIVLDDIWPSLFIKNLQKGETLGDKMKNAFKECFDNGYKQVCIIGTDCCDLDDKTINEAFEVLERSDAVLGPAKDGGYYLLGMKAFHPALFNDKKWGTNTVAESTIKDLQEMKLTYGKLQILTDIDDEGDLTPEVLDKLGYHLK
ncbi:MAG TPA: TIGR04282 family arsenosugar biosynthesis glycosyltransferase [Cyclobacteriaceae bacterium]|nr:TIGR04282 family arsenosugar biosynthesis glycosyltransferase [Cyclobacteriaceae bacterium]